MNNQIKLERLASFLSMLALEETVLIKMCDTEVSVFVYGAEYFLDLVCNMLEVVHGRELVIKPLNTMTHR
jgi:hypothetical protein